VSVSQGERLAQRTRRHWLRARRIAWLISGCAWSIALLDTSRVQAADPLALELSFSAPEGCPQREAVLRSVQAQLPSDFRSATRLRARAEVLAHGPQDFELVLEYSDASGAHDARRVQSETCEAAADAAALLLALALVPSHPPPASPPTAAAQPATAHNEVGVVGQLDTALMPKLAFGAGLQLGLSFGAWRVNLSVLQWVMSEVEHGPVRVQLDYWSVGAGVCYLFGWSVFQTGPCAQVELGRMSGFAEAVDEAHFGGASLLLVALSAQARLRVISPIWLMLDAGAEWLARRPRFEVAELGLVHQPDALGFRLAFGPLLIW
jgi:hypothetical protein